MSVRAGVLGRFIGALPYRLRAVGYFARGWMYTQVIRLAGGTVGRRLRVEAGVQFAQPIHAGYSFGDDVLVGAGTLFDIGPRARLAIGHRVVLMRGELISAIEGVTIGDDTQLGEYGSVRDSDHGYRDPVVPILSQPMVTTPIEIGRDVWVGRGTAILRGSRIGEGAVIGAQSLVKGEIPAFAVAWGVPAEPRSSRRR